MSGYYYSGMTPNSGYRTYQQPNTNQQPNQQLPVPYGMRPGQMPMPSFGVNVPFNANPSTYQSNSHVPSTFSSPSSATSPVYSSEPKRLSLTDACKSGDLSKVQAAIQEGMQPDSTTLTWAFASKNISIINAVSNASAKVDDETLNVAIATNNVAIVQMALKVGAKATSKTYELLNTIQNQDIRKLFATSSSHLDSGPANELTRACQLKRLDLVKSAIRRNIVPQKETLLFAAQSGDTEIVKEVINANAVPHNDPSKESELNHPCVNGNQEIVEDLIYAGVKPDNYTLLNALESENENIIASVAQIRAKPCDGMLNKIMNNYNNEDAAEEDRVSVAESMIELAVKYGARPDKDSLDIAFMLTKRFNWNSWLIDLLVRNGAKPSAGLLNKVMSSYNRQGANKKDAEDEIEIAVKCGAKPDKDSLDISFELTTHFKWNSWLIELLIRNGAQPSSKSLNGVVRVILMPMADYARAIESVLRAGARPDTGTYIRIRWESYEPENADRAYRYVVLLPESTLNELFRAGLKPTAAELKEKEESLNVYKEELKRYQGKRSPDAEDRTSIENFKKLVTHYTDIIRRSRLAVSK